MPYASRGRCQRGFTLMELLVVVGLAVVVLSLAVPAMMSLGTSVRLGAAAQAMQWSMALARSEAIKRNRRVVLCKFSASACVLSGGWEQGWSVFVDANNNAKLDVGEAVLHQEPPIGGDIHITGNSQVDSYISYTALGGASTVSGAFQVGTVSLCSLLNVQAGRQIVLSSSGRARVARVKLTTCP